MTGALDGVRVVDLSQMIAAPYCTQVLGDLGADVIKVEEPALAPDRRINFSPPVKGADGQTTSFSGYWLNANRNKRAITVDIRRPEGKAVLADLVRASDVVVENFTMHARETFQLSEEWGWALKPDLIWASLTGFGQTGPDRARGAFDLLAQARGGYLSITGEPDQPMKAGNSLVDFYAGLHFAVGIMAALRHKEQTGRGQLVDVALLDSLLPCLDGFPMWYSIGGVVPPRVGNFHLLRLPGYSTFPCSDGYICLGGSPGPIWDRLCEAMERPDLAISPPITDRVAWGAFFDTARIAIGEWTKPRTRNEVRDILDAHRVPNEPVRDLREIWEDPQLEARGMFLESNYAPLGRIKTLGNPIKLSDSPVSYRLPPPGPGEHNWEVLRDVLGYSEEQIAQLAADGVTESY